METTRPTAANEWWTARWKGGEWRITEVVRWAIPPSTDMRLTARRDGGNWEFVDSPEWTWGERITITPDGKLATLDGTPCLLIEKTDENRRAIRVAAGHVGRYGGDRLLNEEECDRIIDTANRLRGSGERVVEIPLSMHDRISSIMATETVCSTEDRDLWEITKEKRIAKLNGLLKEIASHPEGTSETAKQHEAARRVTREFDAGLANIVEERDKLREENERLRKEVDDVYQLAAGPPEQAKNIKPLSQWVKTRFVHIWEHNEIADKLQQRIAELEAKGQRAGDRERRLEKQLSDDRDYIQRLLDQKKRLKAAIGKLHKRVAILTDEEQATLAKMKLAHPQATSFDAIDWDDHERRWAAAETADQQVTVINDIARSTAIAIYETMPRAKENARILREVFEDSRIAAGEQVSLTREEAGAVVKGGDDA